MVPEMCQNTAEMLPNRPEEGLVAENSLSFTELNLVPRKFTLG